ncbi:MAG: hypothetical protein E7607_03535 [Ruminococcaceae bacterium]|nr:hypothetical protein [Oscillospiraceae bacterium]
MTTVRFDLSKTNGKIKPMNAVNNGPAGSPVRKTGNTEYYKALEIPYARNHDAAFCTLYGGEHTVDVHRIFKNFDADENDPESYLFAPTDEYIANTLAVGTKTFYRLGASIEHEHKVGTHPPKDFHKWARICEHIIRHYTEGWADGFHYDIQYWEIWNEADCRNPDGSNPCWQGTNEQFIDFYEVAAKYLKSCFPHLKIGGPAFTSSKETSSTGNPIKKMFLDAVKERNIPLDFYSFHGYISTPEKVKELADYAVNSFVSRGLPVPELIYNEWNYVKGWIGEEYKYSRYISKYNVKGTSLIASAMCVGQATPIDMMMYYDARPGGWCGIFSDIDLSPTKPYYAFYYFKELPKLGDYVDAECSVENIYSAAATNGKDSALLLTYYNDDDSTEGKLVKVEFENVKSANGVKVEYILTDDTHDAELIREEIFTAEQFALYINMKLFDTYLIKITAL